jgi:amino acid transporter
VSAPRGIVWGVIAGMITGLAFFLGLLYSINNNIDAVINGDTDQPVINVFKIAFTDKDGFHNKAGSLSISILLLISVYLGGFSHLTVTTRIAFAMSRDGALPFFSKHIYGVYGKNLLPLRSIIFVFMIDSFLVLLPLINDTTFSAITSISTIGY